MTNLKLLVANRGEIAIRIFRAAAELGMSSVAVYPADDEASLHTRKADEAMVLPGRGAAAYLDASAILKAAREAGATAVHPGYGFLSENAGFARACADSGVVFVGPAPDTLEIFGDKHKARDLARTLGVPVLPGTAAPTTLEEAQAFMAGLGPDGAVMVKAVAGGGGRGLRPARTAAELADAFARCRSEASASFGSGDLFVEKLIRSARHIEVQIVGDGSAVMHVWERDCSLQRQRQKLVELAPAPNLDPAVRQRLLDAALTLARAAGYRSLGTFEFLVDRDSGDFFFIEANPRLQVEHTVTEAVTGLDLVDLQLRLATGARLADLGLTADAPPIPRGMAMQLRVNTETMQPDGSAKPGGGTMTVFEPPSGAGIRVDSYGYAGYRTNPSYDSLLAKLIVHAGSGRLEDVTAKGYRALCEFHVAGVATNIGFLQNLVRQQAVRLGTFDTGYVEANAAELSATGATIHPRFYAAPNTPDPDRAAQTVRGRAGVKVDASDPLSVLAYGQSAERGQRNGPSGAARVAEQVAPEGMIAIQTPLQGTVVTLAVQVGDAVPRGAEVCIMEAMKMEHAVIAPEAWCARSMSTRVTLYGRASSW